jgi:hypothetical protein
VLPFSATVVWYFGLPFVNSSALAGTIIPEAYALPANL